jgi:hypothetical protein
LSIAAVTLAALVHPMADAEGAGNPYCDTKKLRDSPSPDGARPGLDVRLTLPRKSFQAGDVVSPWLINRGTVTVTFGVFYRVDRYVGRRWKRVGGVSTGIHIAFISQPGDRASCWDWQVPSKARPGPYRFVLDMEPLSDTDLITRKIEFRVRQ